MKAFIIPSLLVTFWTFVLISQEHRLMELKLLIPKQQKELSSLKEEVHHLQVELECTLSPVMVLDLLRTPPYSQLDFAQKELRKE